MGKKLFAEDEEFDNTISVDEGFVKRFEHNNRRADLHRLKELEKHGEASVTSSESDDSEFDSDHSSQGVEEFIDKLIQVKTRNPSIYYDKDAHLFSADDASKPNREKKKKKKVAYLKDVVAMQSSGFIDVEEEDEEKKEAIEKSTYYQEQEELRKEFLKASGEAGYDGEFLKEKNVSVPIVKSEEELDHKLEEYFGDDRELNESNQFLKDYFRKKMWLEKEDNMEPDDEEVDAAILDEYELDRQQKFEEDFCYRHEENVGDRILGHSRIVDGSVRKKSNTRKEQRRRREERIKEADIEKREELKRLKNLKKEEMAERMRKVMEAAGLRTSSHCELELGDLDEEFDPDEYDKMMSETFDENYYHADDADPEFGSDNEGKPICEEEEELGDGFYAARERILKKTREIELDEGDRKRKREMLVMEEAREEMLEEYYKLDYEDTIGDLKTRFRYAKVDPNRYGLKAVDIISVDDKELNNYVSMKKLAPYREKEWKLPKGKRYEFKMKLKEMVAINGTSKKLKKSKNEENGVKLKKSKNEEDELKADDKQEVSRQSKRRRRRQAELKISHSRRLAYGQAVSKPKH